MVSRQQLQAELENALAKEPAFSGVVWVSSSAAQGHGHPGAPLALCRGLAQRSEPIPNRVDTRFATASGSKIFTAIAVLQLIEQGRFELDSSVAGLLDLGGWPVAPEVTVEHLLTHSSGLPDYYDEERLTEQDCLRLLETHPVHTLLSPRDYLPMFPDRPVEFPAGARFRYNNGGYVLLALLVEEQGGMPFQRFIERSVFEPAQMTVSGYFRTDALPHSTALGYLEPEPGLRTNIFRVPVIGSGDGGAFVSAGDWARFWEALTCDRLLRPRTLAEMLSPRFATGLAPGLHYGHGIWLWMGDGTPSVAFVMGDDFGVAMYSGRFIERGLTASVLSNGPKGAGAVWRHIREFLV